MDAGGHALVRRVDALHVEGAQLVFHERRKVSRELHHLGIVVADDQVEGVRVSLCDLLADDGRRG